MDEPGLKEITNGIMHERKGKVQENSETNIKRDGLSRIIKKVKSNAGKRKKNPDLKKRKKKRL